ncbi:MAG: Fpg/Nei family DNA glycosylase [Acidobacteria bacterium]|nr:Fpg/Nei family DNA glycosylase [Acidobacteriota bacterium]
MPEGDTIYRAARALQKALGGRVVTGFETGLAKLASVNDDEPVVGRVVERVEARGKWCLMYFSGDLILATHMLMSGSWHIYRVGERWRMPRRAMRVVVRVGAVAEDPQASCEPMSQSRDMGHPGSLAGFEAVLFNAQVAEFFTARRMERSGQVPKLGPDILSGEFTVAKGVEAMRAYAARRPEAEVGVVLLNQRVMAGLGNVYKSEVAFAAGVHPFRQMGTVTEREMERMVEVSQRYMRANVADGAGDGIVTYAGNRRTTRSMDKEERLWVYGRRGEECRRCGAAIARRIQGEQVRSTYWCAQCQPWVAAEGQRGGAPEGDVAKRVVGRRRSSC